MSNATPGSDRIEHGRERGSTSSDKVTKGSSMKGREVEQRQTRLRKDRARKGESLNNAKRGSRKDRERKGERFNSVKRGYERIEKEGREIELRQMRFTKGSSMERRGVEQHQTSLRQNRARKGESLNNAVHFTVLDLIDRYKLRHYFVLPVQQTRKIHVLLRPCASREFSVGNGRTI